MKKYLVSMVCAVAPLCIWAVEPIQCVFTVTPPMHCTNCENKIKSNLRFEKGVKKVDASAEAQEVVITYDPTKTDEEKLIKAFLKIGYEATPEVEVTEIETSETKQN